VKKRVLGLDNDDLFKAHGVFMSRPPTTDRRDYICWSHATLKHFIVYDGRLRIQHENIDFKVALTMPAAADDAAPDHHCDAAEMMKKTSSTLLGLDQPS
jgi:hypothetical protein